MSLAKRLRQRHWHLGLGFDKPGEVLRNLDLHLLLQGDGLGAVLLGFGSGDPRIGLGGVGLQAGTDVLPNLNGCNVDGDDLKGGLGVETALEQGSRDLVGIRQHLLVTIRGAIDVMIPWPTRATIVSSVAPPMSCAKLVRTVTRALMSNSMPLQATALSTALSARASGQSMIFGVTLVRTASSTSRPARSIAAARSKSNGMPARWAEMIARMTFETLPPAR